MCLSVIKQNWGPMWLEDEAEITLLGAGRHGTISRNLSSSAVGTAWMSLFGDPHRVVAEMVAGGSRVLAILLGNSLGCSVCLSTTQWQWAVTS